MPTRNVNLAEKLDGFAASKAADGGYEKSSEVVRTSQRALEPEEREYEVRLRAVHAALVEGEHSGVADDGVFDRVRARAGISRQR